MLQTQTHTFNQFTFHSKLFNNHSHKDELFHYYTGQEGPHTFFFLLNLSNRLKSSGKIITPSTTAWTQANIGLLGPQAGSTQTF